MSAPKVGGVKLTHVLVVGAGVAIAYVLIKKPATTKPLTDKLKNWGSMITGRKTTAAKADGLDGASDVEPTAHDASFDESYHPSLGTTGLDTGGPAGPTTNVQTTSQWFLSNPISFHS